MGFALGTVLGILGVAISECEFQKAAFDHRDLLNTFPESTGIEIVRAHDLCCYLHELRFSNALDNAVVRMVLRGGCSYAEVAEELEGKLSRQVVGQLFHRRVEELNADKSEETVWYRDLLEEGPFATLMM